MLSYTHFAALKYIDVSTGVISKVETPRTTCRELACMLLVDLQKQFASGQIVEMSADNVVFWKVPQSELSRRIMLVKENFVKVGCDMHKLKALYDYYEANYNKH